MVRPPPYSGPVWGRHTYTSVSITLRVGLQMERLDTWQEAMLAAGREQGLDALVEIVLTALRQELPVLHDDTDLLEAARSSVAANIAVVTDLAGGTVALNELEPPPQAVAFTRELARRNLPVADLARAYRVAQRALWYWGADQIQQRVSDPEARSDAIEGLSKATFATGDIFSSMVMERYALERERWLRSADAVRAATVADLLSGAQVDVDQASRRIRYELRQEHQAFVVWVEDESAHPEAAALAIAGQRALLMPMGSSLIAGWCPPGAMNLDAAPEAYVALGGAGAGIAGFRTSHHEAMEARRVARLRSAAPSVTSYEDVALLALLTTDSEQATLFAQRRLGDLASDDESARRLASTLLCVYECGGSPRKAAGVLGVHENTVAKRLRSAQQLLGDAGDAPTVELHAALLIIGAGNGEASEVAQ